MDPALLSMYVALNAAGVATVRWVPNATAVTLRFYYSVHAPGVTPAYELVRDAAANWNSLAFAEVVPPGSVLSVKAVAFTGGVGASPSGPASYSSATRTTIPWTPKIVYPGGTILCTRPMEPPTPGWRGVGGAERSGAGVVASFLIADEYLLTVPLVFSEADWPAVLAWVRFGALGGAFTFFPDLNVNAPLSCYLDAPKLGGDVQPTRHTYPGMWKLTVTLRRTTPEPFDVRFYA